MSTSRRARGSRKARAQNVLRLALTAAQVTDLRRALMLAMHHVMANAKAEERSCAAMEAADYKLLDALVAGELVKQGIASEPARASEEPA